MGSVTVGDDVPVAAGFAEQKVADGASGEVGLPVVRTKKLACLMEEVKGLGIQVVSFCFQSREMAY